MLQVERDQMRAGAPLGAAAAAASGPACAARCESTAACLSWVFTRGAAKACQLQSDGPSHIETRPWLFCSAGRCQFTSQLCIGCNADSGYTVSFG